MVATMGANYVILRFMKDVTIFQIYILKWKIKSILKMFGVFKLTLMIHYIRFTLQILNQINYIKK
jgi:phage-related protein